MKTKTIVKIILVFGLLGSIYWFIEDKSFESLISCISFLGSFVAMLVVKDKASGEVILKQKGGKSSKNFQSGGNMTINK